MHTEKGSAYSLQPGSVRTWVDASHIVDEVFTICTKCCIETVLHLI